MVAHRNRQRQERKEKEWTQIAIVGYTNAGKSTLFNRLTQSDTLEEDLLFATLDTTTRKYQLTPNFQVLLTDTVGFIQDLPTTLVKSFRSTLEEVLEAHYILHVVDVSHPDYEQHEQIVKTVLKEIGVENVPIFKVYNKRDLLQKRVFVDQEHPNTMISAIDANDLAQFQTAYADYLLNIFQPYQIHLDFTQGKIMNQLKKYTVTVAIHFLEEENVYEIKGYIPQRLVPRFQKYMKK